MILCPDHPVAVRDRLRMELHRPAVGLAKPQLSAPLALARGEGEICTAYHPHLGRSTTSGSTAATAQLARSLRPPGGANYALATHMPTLDDDASAVAREFPPDR
jgi:hypothetical protein